MGTTWLFGIADTQQKKIHTSLYIFHNCRVLRLVCGVETKSYSATTIKIRTSKLSFTKYAWQGFSEDKYATAKCCLPVRIKLTVQWKPKESLSRHVSFFNKNKNKNLLRHKLMNIKLTVHWKSSWFIRDFDKKKVFIQLVICYFL